MGALDPDDRCIRPESLVSGHALSFDEQPYFAQLVKCMRSADRPLALVVGAGISMDSGLPSWMELVNALEQQLVDDERLEAFRTLYAGDLERRAGTVLHLAGHAGLDGHTHRFLQHGLYGNMRTVTPGLLALAVSRLVAAYPKRVSLITTNYDQVLEAALETLGWRPLGFSLNNWDEWIALPDDKHRAAVMHLHGLAYLEAKSPLEPLVLSEKDFRKHGPSIQAKLVGLLGGNGQSGVEPHVVIVGASLTDRSVTTPLAELGESGNRFVISTPTLAHDDLEPRRCADIAVWQSEALRDSLHVKPILLKSYSQMTQIVTELGLAAAAPREYRKPGNGLRTEESLHYGVRLRVALQQTYRSLGASRDGSMRGDAPLKLSKKLHRLTLAKGGPNDRLEELKRRHLGECSLQENIGLFLWLRALPESRGGESQKAQEDSMYQLRLVSSSAYAHWDNWSANRTEQIEPTSPNAAVQAVFGGTSCFRPILPYRQSVPWQGAWAVPLVVSGGASQAEVGGAPLDQIILGALAVNTTCQVEEPREGAWRNKDGLADASVLAVADEAERQYFTDGVVWVMAQLLETAD